MFESTELFEEGREEKTQRFRKRVSDFLKQDAGYDRLRAFIGISSKRKDTQNIRLVLDMVGDCYISAKHEMHIGMLQPLVDAFPDMSLHEIMTFHKGFVAHELAHFDETHFQSFIDFIEKDNKQYRMLRKHVLNLLEDGRIERKKTEQKKMLGKYFDFINLSILEANEINATEESRNALSQSEFQQFMAAFWSICKAEIYPKGYEDFTERVKEKVEEALPWISQGVIARNTSLCGRHAEELVRIAKELMTKEEHEEQQFAEQGFMELEVDLGGGETTDSQPDGQDQQNEAPEGEANKRFIIRPGTYQEGQKTKESMKQVLTSIEKGERERTKEKSLTNEDVTEVEKQYKGEQYVERTPNAEQHGVPTDIVNRGNAFRRDVEKILKSNERYTLYGQRKGLLNPNDFYKLATHDFHIFKKIGNPELIDAAAYVLRDGSGSMSSSTKAHYCSEAAAVVEEGLKSLMPYKDVIFHTQGNQIQHEVIKNFEETPSQNVSWNYSNTFSYTGCNKDGFSIRIATRELSRRPERHKLLLVLSDGLPSDYHSEEEAIMDVKKAIAEAKSKNIIVVAIFFGSESERKHLHEKYQYMYGDYIVSCAPEHIEREYIRIVKQFIQR